MSLDGLRAWIGVVERKLAMRTRVFLVLVAIAVGGAGAGIYLAIEAADEAASSSEVQALEERLDTQTAASATVAVTKLEAELKALRRQVARLQASDGGTSEASNPHQGRNSDESTGGVSGPSQTEIEKMKEAADATGSDKER